VIELTHKFSRYPSKGAGNQFGSEHIRFFCHLRQFVGSSLKTLLDEVSVQRVEIDFIELRGPAFAGWNRQKTLLALVREGLAEAVFISAGKPQASPTEILRKKQSC
jgi:hypothetical protein